MEEIYELFNEVGVDNWIKVSGLYLNYNGRRIDWVHLNEETKEIDFWNGDPNLRYNNTAKQLFPSKVAQEYIFNRVLEEF